MIESARKLPISVCVVTHNEEHNIRRLLNSCHQMYEVVVVDSGSVDRTVEIAEEMGATVSYNQWQGYATQKAYAMSLCTQDWVLNLDADEELTPGLIKAFEDHILSGNTSAVRCQRNDVFIGKPMNRWLKKPNNRRFYRKELASFDCSQQVHETADIYGREVSIPEHFNHYGYSTVELVTNKTNLYSSLRAQEKHQRGKKFSLLKLVLIFPLVFIKTWLLQRHILFGVRGFALSVTSAYYAFMKEAKLYELYEANRSPSAKK
jgi:glycosyltransferase involved in cell wall biosynthesis